MNDFISREAAIDALYANMPGLSEIAFLILQELPSAQPNLDEWCETCGEYDQEQHCCPRFNRVIRTAMQYAQTEQWRTPCDWCKYNPPSSMDGKPCTVCPAVPYQKEGGK